MTNNRLIEYLLREQGFASGDLPIKVIDPEGNHLDIVRVDYDFEAEVFTISLDFKEDDL